MMDKADTIFIPPCQTRIDFTVYRGAALVALIVLMVFGILTALVRMQVLRMLYACAGALIFGLYLLIDTQMMVGGGHKVAISPEDYVVAALNLYTDVVQIFMFSLMIVGKLKS